MPSDGEPTLASVFVDESGRRARIVRVMGRAIAVLIVIYLATFLFGLARAPWVPRLAIPGSPSGRHRKNTTTLHDASVLPAPAPGASTSSTSVPGGTTTTLFGQGPGSPGSTATTAGSATTTSTSSPATTSTSGRPTTSTTGKRPTTSTTHPGGRP